jgi:hypothetical protein
MTERRYSRYKQADVWAQLAHMPAATGIEVIRGTVAGNSVKIKDGERVHLAVVLARSSDWYNYSLNCTERYKHNITCIIAGTHDSCVNIPVWAMDTMRWHFEKTYRGDFGDMMPILDENGDPMKGADEKYIGDLFDEKRKTHYGHNMLIGALMQDRMEAVERLKTLPEQTRLRIEREVKRLHKRRAGRPLPLKVPKKRKRKVA